MTEKVEKSKQNTQMKHIPKDAQVIMSIMRDMDIVEYEPRVINQLLEFTYRYIACVLEDAKTYANHAKNRSIDIDDVKLALQIQLEQIFTTPPLREVTTEMARTKNAIQLPLIKSHCGIRLPQDRYCLASSNLKIKLPQFIKKNTKSSGQFSEKNVKMLNKSNLGMVKRANNVPIVSRTQTVTIPRTVTKFTNIPPKAVPKPKIHISQNTPTQQQQQMNINSINEDANVSNQLKRKREDETDIN